MAATIAEFSTTSMVRWQGQQRCVLAEQAARYGAGVRDKLVPHVQLEIGLGTSCAGL